MHLGRALMALNRAEEAQKYLDQYQTRVRSGSVTRGVNPA